MPEDVKVVVTKREDSLPHSGEAKTPGSVPSNIAYIAISGFALVLIRSVRVFVMSLAGLLTTAGIGSAGGGMPADFAMTLQAAVIGSAMTALMSALWNTGELLLKIDEKFPQMRA